MDIILYKPSPLGPNGKESKTYHEDIRDLTITSSGVIYFLQAKVKNGLKSGGVELICTNMPFKVICAPEERDNISRII